MYWSWIRTRHQHYGRVGLEPDPERCKRYQLRGIHTALLAQNAGITEQLLTHTSIHTPSIDNPIQNFPQDSLPQHPYSYVLFLEQPLQYTWPRPFSVSLCLSLEGY